MQDGSLSGCDSSGVLPFPAPAGPLAAPRPAGKRVRKKDKGTSSPGGGLSLRIVLDYDRDGPAHPKVPFQQARQSRAAGFAALAWGFFVALFDE